MSLKTLLLASLLLFAPPSVAQDRAWPASGIPAKFTPPIDARDYVKREAMIPMGDGTKLYTVIVMPKGAKDLSIILTRPHPR